MSSNEKLKKSEDWQSDLLKQFFVKRNLPRQNQIKTNRFSNNFSNELKKLHNTKKMANIQKTTNVVESNLFDDTVLGAGSHQIDQMNNDESFEVLERMCDKTVSDPDSTLYQYINSDHKEIIMEDAKKRSCDSVKIEKETAMNAEFKKLNLEDNAFEKLKCFDDKHSPGVDCTQLDDIEAPSRFWDNTIVDQELGVQTSPIKMVGLLRPSTIIEACEDDSIIPKVDSSQSSNHTEVKESDHSKTISSYYETANDQTANTSNEGHAGDVHYTNVDDMFYAALPKVKSDLQKLESEKVLIDTHKKIDLIDLENCADNSLDSNQVSENRSGFKMDDSIIEIFSDDEDNELDIGDVKEEDISNSSSQISSDLINFDIEENKENDEAKSKVFNDTLEEVDYMMRKGLEYMAATKDIQPNAEINNSPASRPIQIDKNIFSPSFKKQSEEQVSKSSQKVFNETKIQSKPPTLSHSGSAKKIAMGNCNSNRFELEMKSRPKVAFFKQPSGIPMLRQKELKQPYSHVISPIRTYMQKTATAPLMRSIKSKTTQADVMNSTAFRELELESRLYNNTKLSKECNINFTKISGVPNVKSLPKKAYISSDIKQIVDERTPVTIPGGQKIHKFLETAMMPAVLRHEGKIKLPGGFEKQRINNSLADLSTTSGDISMYTMKDAKKL